MHFHRTALEAVLLVHQLERVKVLFGVIFGPGSVRIDVEITSEPVRDRVIVERGDDRALRRSSTVWVGGSGRCGIGSILGGGGGGNGGLLFGKGGVANRLRREDADNFGEVSVRAGGGYQDSTPGYFREGGGGSLVSLDIDKALFVGEVAVLVPLKDEVDERIESAHHA